MKAMALLLGLLLCQGAAAQALSWAAIRDGSLYLQTGQGDTLAVSWTPAWQADANQEHLYLLDGQGRLHAERVIDADETRGRQRWPLAAGRYRLEIPGYSFRRYRVEHDERTAALYAPVKVHFNAELPADTELYFKVGAGERAFLAGKFHGGVRALQAERLADGQRLALALKPYPQHWHFDQVALPVTTTEQVWRLRLLGSGKAAFWLDGTANLFALRPEHLQPLREDDGQVRLTLYADVLGSTPRLGSGLPYERLPPATHEAVQALGLRTAGYYSFVDVVGNRPQFEDKFRQLYRERFAIDHDLTLMAATGRKSDLVADDSTQAALQAWLASTVAMAKPGLHYISFADEPNASYRNYSSFQQLFDSLAWQVRRYPGAHEAGVRIAMPASSRFVNGPFLPNARDYRGIDWARRLLQNSGENVDALAWHEWMVRDLLATRSYRDAVRQAAQLVGLDSDGRPRKALLLDQTNISSGGAVSPYEQDTHFASLWWASVVINASQDGLLDMLNWFLLADEDDHLKGLLRPRADGSFELKPVGLAQQFISQHWLGQVLRLDNDAFEVDVLAMASAQRRSLLGVNKANRQQHVSLQGSQVQCPPADSQLLYMGDDSVSRKAPFDCQDGVVRFTLPGQTLFALTWNVI